MKRYPRPRPYRRYGMEFGIDGNLAPPYLWPRRWKERLIGWVNWLVYGRRPGER